MEVGNLPRLCRLFECDMGRIRLRAQLNFMNNFSMQTNLLSFFFGHNAAPLSPAFRVAKSGFCVPF